MGLLDKAKRLAGPNGERAKKLVAGNADKITGTVDKVAGSIDKKTGGKYRDKLDKVEGAVKKAVDAADGGRTRGYADPATGFPSSDPLYGDPGPDAPPTSRDHGDGLP